MHCPKPISVAYSIGNTIEQLAKDFSKVRQAICKIENEKHANSYIYNQYTEGPQQANIFLFGGIREARSLKLDVSLSFTVGSSRVVMCLWVPAMEYAWLGD